MLLSGMVTVKGKGGYHKGDGDDDNIRSSSRTPMEQTSRIAVVPRNPVAERLRMYILLVARTHSAAAD